MKTQVYRTTKTQIKQTYMEVKPTGEQKYKNKGKTYRCTEMNHYRYKHSGVQNYKNTGNTYMCTYQGCTDKILLKKFLVVKNIMSPKHIFCVTQNYQ